MPVTVSIDELANALTMRGFEVSAIELANGDQSDAVLDLEINTNRPDCLSVVGIAREVATMYGKSLSWPTLAIVALLCTALACYSIRYIEHRVEVLYGEEAEETRTAYNTRFFTLFLYGFSEVQE